MLSNIESDIESHIESNKPIIYSCSGCSNLAQMAHNISLNLDEDGIVEMSCVAGVVGNVQPILNLAKTGRPIIAIDGCELACTKVCLEVSGINVDHYFTISDFGFEKRCKWKDSLSENTIAMRKVYDALAKAGISYS